MLQKLLFWNRWRRTQTTPTYPPATMPYTVVATDPLPTHLAATPPTITPILIPGAATAFNRKFAKKPLSVIWEAVCADADYHNLVRHDSRVQALLHKKIAADFGTNLIHAPFPTVLKYYESKWTHQTALLETLAQIADTLPTPLLNIAQKIVRGENITAILPTPTDQNATEFFHFCVDAQLTLSVPKAAPLACSGLLLATMCGRPEPLENLLRNLLQYVRAQHDPEASLTALEHTLAMALRVSIKLEQINCSEVLAAHKEQVMRLLIQL